MPSSITVHYAIRIFFVLLVVGIVVGFAFMMSRKQSSPPNQTNGNNGTKKGTTTPSTPTSGKYYIYFLRDMLYLNTNNINSPDLVSDVSDASVVYWDAETNLLSKSDMNELVLEGVQVGATPGISPSFINVLGKNVLKVVLFNMSNTNWYLPVIQGTRKLAAGQYNNTTLALNDPSYEFVLIPVP
jgi:hypothetical protein